MATAPLTGQQSKTISFQMERSGFPARSKDKEARMQDLIPLTVYAAQHGVDDAYLRARARAGKFQTATKLGRDWLISPDEPLIDLRVKSGKYIGAKRARKPQ